MITPKKLGHITIKVTASSPVAGDSVVKKLLVKVSRIISYCVAPIWYKCTNISHLYSEDGGSRCFQNTQSPLPSCKSITWLITVIWAGHVARMGEERGVYRVLVGKPEGRRPLGRPRHRWVDNIRMDLQEVGSVYMDWIGLAQDRDRWRTLVSAVMNLRVPWNAGSFLTSCRPVSFSRRTLHHGVSKYTSTPPLGLRGFFFGEFSPCIFFYFVTVDQAEISFYKNALSVRLVTGNEQLRRTMTSRSVY